ncbi:lysine 5,6-aminomutase subunit beta [Tepidimicrobium xylanilyticum]|uniref:Beta-lysine 5,6-aminomutase beta subunit n=1 Tax=Tepidimicrobium xylanilyticum TaxID=1123352 RepID=A0A1H2WBK0_9FIRM|nr:OAM dimerization domain-containing protein [Tepidimicrobium xylanilyticum]GMG95287.1 L-beta-lysine 5,6-aminomutase beta subunit [Tepidimicrobium xylanilyticum]SDW77980.1 beta-lysine 5,6-aminomutase beta subunit [Tepidimicrobium xylanilyticum]
MLDLTRVKPYGDTLNDGMVQLSFTLPVPYGDEAKETARQLAKKMGLEEPSVVYAKDLVGFTYFILYGKLIHTVDFTKIEVPKVDVDVMSKEEVEQFIKDNINRDIVIVGACTGTDAHTVGIDAIMNMKGYAGHYGLERYEGVEAYNLGSQVPNEDLVAKAIELNADAILVSQVVTQKDVHIPNLTQLVELLEAEGIRDKVILVCGGPRISHELAKELGYDAGFGPGTFAEDVASFIVTEMVKRNMV